ncbi:MAG: hypothetical protein BMS9Abin13_408 [Patescibacteria group bacterium]|nr:MAG: hypothetical protein BMS9Abin13_408 [Patescibacteria group bacterium]
MDPLQKLYCIYTTNVFVLSTHETEEKVMKLILIRATKLFAAFFLLSAITFSAFARIQPVYVPPQTNLNLLKDFKINMKPSLPGPFVTPEVKVPPVVKPVKPVQPVPAKPSN